jgi:tetratricopeptide (TPR) repeat protein
MRIPLVIFLLVATHAVAGCANFICEERGEIVGVDYRKNMLINEKKKLDIFIVPSVERPILRAAFHIRRTIECEASSRYRHVRYEMPFSTGRELKEFAFYTLPLPLHVLYFFLHWDFEHAGEVLTGINPFKNIEEFGRTRRIDMPPYRGEWELVQKDEVEDFSPGISEIRLNDRRLEPSDSCRVSGTILNVNVKDLLKVFGGTACVITLHVPGDETKPYKVTIDRKLIAALREVSIFEKETAQRPDDPRAAIDLARVYRKYGDKKHALKYLRKAFELRGNTLDLEEIRTLADSFFELNAFEEARAAYRIVLSAGGGRSRQNVFRAAVSAERTKNDEEALKLYRKAFRLDPFHAATSRGIGRRLFSRSEYEDAYIYMYRAYRLNPADADAGAGLAGLRRRLVSDLDSAVDKESPEALAEWEKGLRLMLIGEYLDAIARFQKAVNARDVTSGQATRQIIRCFTKLAGQRFADGDYSGALESLEYVKEYNVESPHVLENMAAAYNNLACAEKDPAVRVRHLEKAVLLDPLSIPAIVNLAAAYLDTGRVDELSVLAGRLSRVAAVSPYTRILEAKLLALKGEFIRARAVLAHLRKHRPGRVSGLDELAVFVVEKEFAACKKTSGESVFSASALRNETHLRGEKALKVKARLDELKKKFPDVKKLMLHSPWRE